MLEDPHNQTLIHLSKIIGYLQSKQIKEADPV